MGNHSFLDAKQHLLGLMLSANSLQDAESIHAIAHALEILAQCEHMDIAVHGFKQPIDDFPNQLDLE